MKTGFIFHENRFRYIIKIVSNGNNLQEMSNPVFWEKNNKQEAHGPQCSPELTAVS